MGKITVFDIVLHEKPSHYKPGDEIIGVCLLNVTEKVQMKGLKITFFGGSEVRWETERTEGDKTVTDTYSDSEVYVNCTYDVSDPSIGLFKECIPVGQLKIPFRFQLPSSGIPSSFESTYCHIRYKVKAEISQPWYKPNTRKEVMIPVLVPTTATGQTAEDLALEVPVVAEAHKNMGLIWKSGRISLRAQINNHAFSPGDIIEVKCNIENFSNDSVTPTVKIMETTTCYVRSNSKTVSQKVNELHGKPMGKGTILDWTSPLLQVPRHCRSVRDCRLIKNEYLVRVTLAIPALLERNLSVNIPIVVGDKPNIQAISPPVIASSDVLGLLPLTPNTKEEFTPL